MKSKKKDCFNCRHLEWMESEYFDPKGYICHVRNYRTNTEEEKHLSRMESDKYLKTSKKCCEYERRRRTRYN